MEPIIAPESTLHDELNELRPNHPPSLLSRGERHRLVERAFLGLYRWYVARSQATRDWNPDLTFDWKNLRKDHSDEVLDIVEGFYAVEQYVPDYVTQLLLIVRKSYGRSHFQLRWGSEEEKHADMWRNTVLFSGRRSQEWVEEYGDTLRAKEWKLPWEDPLHMLFYTVFQERATQVNYLNLGLAAKGEHDHPAFANDKDPVLAHACRTIAIDEAAHYNFFLEGARVMMYYFPEDSLDAMVDVLRHFAMPAGQLIPNYEKFSELLHKTTIFGPRQHITDVVRIALKQLGAESLKKVEEGIRRSREVPNLLGGISRTSIFESIDFHFVEDKVKRLFGRVNEYEEGIGLDQVAPTIFAPNPEFQALNAPA